MRIFPITRFRINDISLFKFGVREDEQRSRTIIVQPSRVDLNERSFRNWHSSLFAVYIANEYARVFGRYFGNTHHLENTFKGLTRLSGEGHLPEGTAGVFH